VDLIGMFRRFVRTFRSLSLADFIANAVTQKQQWALKTGSNSTAKDQRSNLSFPPALIETASVLG
jgi:hypothetical protein